MMTWSLLFRFLGAWLLVLATDPGFAGGLPAAPMLRIETGMHVARITGFSADTAGNFAVTSSTDKTVRVWNIDTGRLMRVLRPPIGLGNDGELFAGALSPDGRLVAVAGRYGAQYIVYIFDRDSGRVLHRLTGLIDEPDALRFSLDGRWLAARHWYRWLKPDGGGPGPLVWDTTASGETLGRSNSGKAFPYDLSWSSDGRLATIDADAKVHVYGLNSGRVVPVANTATLGDAYPWTVAFSPDGKSLAVGYLKSKLVDVLDAATLELRFRTAASDNGLTGANMVGLSWSSDSQTLFLGENTLGNAWMHRWGQGGKGAPEVLRVPLRLEGLHGEVVLQAVPQGLLVGSGTPLWRMINQGGLGTEPHLGWQRADFTGSRDDFAVNGDATEVQFCFEFPCEPPYRFDLRRRRLQSGVDPNLKAGLRDGLEQHEGTVALDGHPIPGSSSDIVIFDANRAISHDRQRFALGHSGISAFGVREGKLWTQPALNGVDQLVISPDGKRLVAAYRDGTIRWHRMSDGQELLAFFPHADHKRWVLWTPSGYYDASPGGEDLIGWHVNRGEDHAADFFPASRFRERFYRPDIIDRVLDTLDEGQAVAGADAARGVRIATGNVADVLPPVIEMLSPTELLTDESQTTLRYRTRSGADAPVTAVRVRIDGQAAPDARNLVALAADGDMRQNRVSLPPHDSVVQLFAENRHGVSTPATIQVRWKGAAPQAAVPAPALYVLAIGVAKYQHKDITKLNFAAKDAHDFAAAFEQQKGKLYRDVKVKVVTDDEATRDNITSALDWLRRQVTEHDVGMLFLSGHGFNDARGYTFLPVNADPSELLRTGVTRYDITGTLQAMSGKRIVFLDTCHSGNVMGSGFKAPFSDMTGIVNELNSAENGVVVFASSTGRQYSLEKPEWNNGAFTKAVIEGLAGGADYTKSGRVTHRALAFYVSEKVKQLTNGEQTSANPTPSDVPDFPLTAVR